MSDIQQRRYEDARMDKLEKTIENIKDDLVLVRQKIFNGFSHSIASTENKVNYIDTQNKADHKDLRLDIKDLSKKFDKILWMFGAGAAGIIIKDIIQRALWDTNKQMRLLIVI